jgi:hypothetical protein
MKHLLRSLVSIAALSLWGGCETNGPGTAGSGEPTPGSGAACPHLDATFAQGFNNEMSEALGLPVSGISRSFAVPGVVTGDAGYGVDLVSLRSAAFVGWPWDTSDPPPAGGPTALIFGGLERDARTPPTSTTQGYTQARALFDALIAAPERAEPGSTVRQTRDGAVRCRLVAETGQSASTCHLRGLLNMTVTLGPC